MSRIRRIAWTLHGNCVDQHGAEITAFYMTMGAYDMVIIIDAPNDDAFARLAISIAKGGNIRTATLKAFDEAQYRKIIESVG